MRRKLTAVLAADVVGYSRLMAQDAEGTLATLRRLRTEIFAPTVASKRGRVVKSMGDGWIVAFSAVSDAVECAMQVQDRLKTDGAMQLRMGVHLGDVSEVDEDVFGDAVNIAARLQTIADPGALTISGEARNLLDESLRPSFDDAGAQKLKNIEEPIHVWVRGGEIAASVDTLSAEGFPHLAIKPVVTTDDRRDIIELAEALTGDLATYLNAQRYLNARVSDGREVGAYKIISRLRVRGERLRLECAVFEPSGDQIDILKQDGDIADSFDWQDRAGADLTNFIMRTVISTEAGAAEATSEDERTAEQWMTLAIYRGGPGQQQQRDSMSAVSRAIAANPDLAYPYIFGVITIAASLSMYGPGNMPEYEAKFQDWVATAKRLEPMNSPAQVLITTSQYMKFGDVGQAKADLQTQLRRLPFDTEARFFAGWLHLFMGEPRQALDYLRGLNTGVTYDLAAPVIVGGIALALIQLGRFEEALSYGEEAARINPNYTAAYRFQAAALGQLDRLEEAKAALRKVPAGDSISATRSRSNYPDNPATRNYFDGLRKAGLPE